jgi:hypothetical protein
VCIKFAKKNVFFVAIKHVFFVFFLQQKMCIKFAILQKRQEHARDDEHLIMTHSTLEGQHL